MNHLFESIDFVENPLYEQIISDIGKQQFSVIENFFSLEAVETLRQAMSMRYEEDRFKKAAIGNRLNETIETAVRGDLILWMDETKATAKEKFFFDRINDLVSYLNRTCFLGILHKEFHYAIYPTNTFYKRHLDTFQNDDRRKLSFVCYLNEDGWLPENGGELVLYLNENGQEVEQVIYPFPGRIVIFESQIIEHEVRPVNTERLSITGWLKTR
ncbi:2OG-Fe(II) oxygenase [Tamlana sp. 2_MG-2023]|uniref:2OG-Fe(II) oxygenase n=1 Tax=unclassified Tamlana TaxID=2614803 RepID=UPI0026E1984B|nr:MULTISPECIES: 2OG-Fe(II) oxygenase [unclassified Tamlana]MDO6761174.1 2OG-Fe(II) oxygenase [Tamlana sp. 2_MG-2023]MDO6791493.1 2OG-Fe(II) oxygenase [Tamlana sp. 1_MG-2023]